MLTSRANTADIQQKSNQRQRVRKKALGIDEPQCIGKRMGTSSKVTEGIWNATTLSILKPNENKGTNTANNIIREREHMAKTNAKQNVRESCPCSPSTLINQPNNKDHLRSKEPLKNNDKVSNSAYIPSLVPNMTYASVTHDDEIKDTTDSYSSNNQSPDE